MTNLMERAFLVSIITTCAMAASRQLKEGAKCYWANSHQNQKGICKRFRDCPAAYENLEHYIWPKVCSFIEEEAVVCCTDELAIGDGIENPPKHQLDFARRISERRCEEYTEWEGVVYKVGGGGKPADPKEFPHMAHLGYLKHGRISFRCGGSLISEQFILTAAQCLRDGTGAKVSHAKLGTGNKAFTILAKISRTIPHPDYKPDAKYNDIALVKLAQPIQKFNEYLRPGCLHTTRNIDSEFGTITGWGVTENGQQSKNLLKVNLPFLNFSICSKIYGPSKRNRIPAGLDDRSMVCAGGYEFQKDTCSGDSGGPIQVQIEEFYEMYSIVGVTSFGATCGRTPGVYTRVSYYVPWIESIVWPDGQ